MAKKQKQQKSTDKSKDPRKLLGEYPEQNPELEPKADLAGEIWGVDIDSYPLRDKEEDPRWAVRVMWVWFGLAVGFIGFVATLIVYLAMNN